MPLEVGQTDNGAPAATATPTATPAPAPSAAASLEKIATAAQAPADSSPAEGDVKPPAGAISQPPSATPGEPDFWQRIPEQRRNIILENTRRETEERVRKELKEQYGWAEGIQREHVEAAFGLAQRLQQDPLGFLQQLQHELREHPQYASRFQQPEEEDEAFPEADLRSEPDPKTGQVRETWSRQAIEKILSIQERRLMRAWQQQFGPYQQWAQQQYQAGEEANLHAYTQSIADEALANARELPHFKEHEEEIGKRLLAVPAEVRNRIGAVACLYHAYNSVLKDKVFPGMAAKAESASREQLTRKAAAAAGSVHPQDGAAAAGIKRPRTVDELARHMATLAGGGAA